MAYGVCEDYGQPRCRFGAWFGSYGTVVNRSFVICEKPPFPNTERFVESAYPVAFSPNAQCAPDHLPTAPSDAYVGRGDSFRTYNSQVNENLVPAGPLGDSLRLNLTGEGFMYPSDSMAICRFVKQ